LDQRARAALRAFSERSCLFIVDCPPQQLRIGFPPIHPFVHFTGLLVLPTDLLGYRRIGGRPRVVVDRSRLAELDSEGWTTREIGEEFGISAASVSRLLKGQRRLQNPAAGL